MSSFADVLAAIRKDAHSTTEQGRYFERLMMRLLPDLRDRDFEKVWTWKDWPDRKRLTGMDGKDLGIDLVGKRDDGSYCAIQCKFYDEATTIQKGDIDSFFTELGKEPFESGLIITTTDKWSSNAEKALEGQSKDVPRLLFQELADLDIDWNVLRPDCTRVRPTRKQPWDIQQQAIDRVLEGFKENSRGRLIMACGTGKTLTSLHIAEQMVKPGGNILVLVPSIALLSQFMHEWAWQRKDPQRYLAVCSDAQVDRKDEDMPLSDLVIPATTDAGRIYNAMMQRGNKTTVVFCTYHSLERIKQAQRRGAPDFDLVICDEAHRTTGIEDRDGKAAYFSRILKEDYVKADKRLFMTATPRIYSEAAQAKAKEAGITTFSMDDEAVYGPRFHYINFADAVRDGKLADYKVLVLNIGEKYVNDKMQTLLAENDRLKIDDIGKMVGCYKALRDRGQELNTEGAHEPMRRAVAFANTIPASEQMSKTFGKMVDAQDEMENDGFTCDTAHVDGKMSALERNKKLNWLRADPGSTDDGKICNILFNAKCLTEGVDVPSLDAVMFMQPRASEIDLVQAVGRVMRQAKGKDYGYIIVPVVVANDGDPAAAMAEAGYKTVWKVLNALRAHDDRFQAMISKLELNDNKPEQVQVIGIGLSDREQDSFDDHEPQQPLEGDAKTALAERLNQYTLNLWEGAIFAKIVEKCGERQYWENWAKDVAEIHKTITTRIESLRKVNAFVDETYNGFYAGIRRNINEALTEEDATSMLAQHLITQPVFDALFTDYAFSKANPVSQSMDRVLAQLYERGLEAELESLQGFYDSVRSRAADIDNRRGRQTVIIELYEKFFKTAFPKVAESLGIAYTPIEIVDFVLASADHALQQEFGRSLSDENVHIIDPFTGTGSFINRLISNDSDKPDLIKTKDLKRKFAHELHANEILLLAYYIASVNIEEAYHARLAEQGAAATTEKAEYQTFPGIVLTDTFNLFERKDGSLKERMFPENNARVKRQQDAPIRVVVGNPPWSTGQKSENDAAKNMDYPELDANIRGSYAERSTAANKNALYDSYIRSFRWASDRIGEEGVIAFVSNGGWLDGTSTDGFRQTLAEEFDAIWVFNARGNARLSGEPRRKEKDNVFGQSCRTPVTFTILVKNPANRRAIADIHYHDIGDYLSRQEKLDIVTTAKHIGGLAWQSITPNDDNDWINQRDPMFQTFKAMGSKEVKAGKLAQPDTIFRSYGRGLETTRDAWVYNFSHEKVAQNMSAMIGFYNEQVEGFQAAKENTPDLKVDEFVDNDPTKIKWSSSLKDDLRRGRRGQNNLSAIRLSTYRPFAFEWLYFDNQFNHRTGQMPVFFPTAEAENRVIGIGSRDNFSPLMSKHLPDLEFVEKSQCFPRYCWNKDGEREDNITEACVREFSEICADDSITSDDIFNYVYGVLHAPDYQTRFAADLKKQLPRIPMPNTAQTFAAFRNAGAALAELHLNFATGPEYDLSLLVDGNPVLPNMLEEVDYKVTKMKWAKDGRSEDKSRIIYNNQITMAGIPDTALRYQVSGRPALQWLIDRYQVKRDKDSGITNDPNDWIGEQNDPQWLIKHIKRITHLSAESARIIEGLPAIMQRFDEPLADDPSYKVTKDGERIPEGRFVKREVYPGNRSDYFTDPDDEFAGYPETAFFLDVDFALPNMDLSYFDFESLATTIASSFGHMFRDKKFHPIINLEERPYPPDPLAFHINEIQIVAEEGSFKFKVQFSFNFEYEGEVSFNKIKEKLAGLPRDVAKEVAKDLVTKAVTGGLGIGVGTAIGWAMSVFLLNATNLHEYEGNKQMHDACLHYIEQILISDLLEGQVYLLRDLPDPLPVELEEMWIYENPNCEHPATISIQEIEARFEAEKERFDGINNRAILFTLKRDRKEDAFTISMVKNWDEDEGEA